MISERAIDTVTDVLILSGFTVLREYIDDIKDIDPDIDGFPAFLRIKKTELSELTVRGYDTKSCRAEITFAVRALGGSAGFEDAEELADMTDNAISEAIFSSELIVKNVTCGEIHKNMALGRLEQLIEMTVVTTADEEVS